MSDLRREKAREKADAKQLEQRKNLLAKDNKKKQSLTRIFKTIKACSILYPNGWTARQFSEKYINLYGNLNPYTGEVCLPTYDIHASIRGLMYETSPSSTQHWFQYGNLKYKEQVAPWFCYNKALAVVNNANNWKKTTSEISSSRRAGKGLWFAVVDGPNSIYNWSDEIYGPLPTEEILKIAKEGRRIGVRKKATTETTAAAQ